MLRKASAQCCNNFPIHKAGRALFKRAAPKEIYRVKNIGLVFKLLLFLLPGIHPVYAQEKNTLKMEELLNMSLEELMNVDVSTAAKVSQKMRETPATIRIITADQIRERGYFTLEQALADLPGFQFRNINGFNTYSFLRGLPSQNNLILLLVDGIQINELNSGGFYGGGQFDLANTERIEVVYGPASALYGTNAISGIINIITRKPEKPNSGHISGALGNFKTSSLDFGYEHTNRSNDLGFRIAGMYKTSGKADLREGKGDYNWTDSMENFEDDYAVNGYFRYRNFTAGLTSQLKQSSRTTNYKTIGDQYLDRGTVWNIWFLNGFAGYTYDKNKTWSNSSRIYFRKSNVLNNTIGSIMKADSDSAGDQVGYYRPNRLIGLENQFNYHPTNSLYFIAGLNYEHESIAENFSQSHSDSQDIIPPTPGKPAKLENDLLSIYMQGQFWFLKYFQFVAGARQDFSSYYHQVLTPRFALVYNFRKFTSKFMYSEAFRAPRPWDYSAGIGNPDLMPEKMKSSEIFMSYSLSKFVNLEGSVYRNHLSKLLVIDYIDSLGNWRWLNSEKVSTTGLEAGFNFKRNRIGFYGYYTFNSPKDKNGNLIAEIAKHVANAGVSLNLYKGLNLHLAGYYYGQRINPKKIAATGTNIIDGAFILNGTLGWFNFHGMNLQLLANNILDTEYYHPSNLTPDRYRQPQRSFLLKATWNF
jgi:outer membrane receptor for ferrienterochelin and colicins